MLVCIAPSGPIQPMRARVRPAPHGLETLEDLHRADLGSAGDRAAGERGRKEVEGVTALLEDPGHGRDEVLDRGRSLEAAEARDANGARPADPSEVVAQDVDDHHVLGAVLGAGQQLARERPVRGGVAPARAGALDRIGLDDAVRVDREERFGRGREEGAGVDRSTGSDRGRGRPRRATGRPSADGDRGPTGRHRTASRAGGSGSPGRDRPRRCARGSGARPLRSGVGRDPT